MEIRLELLADGPQPLLLKEPVEAESTWYSQGCRDHILLELNWQIMGGSWWITAQIKGNFAFECLRCGYPLPSEFSLPIKVLVSRKGETGLNWTDNDGLDWNEYEVEIGPDILEIPLDEIVLEQIILNNNATNAPENLQNSCPGCENSKDFNYNCTEPNEIDPRWNKLKSLRDRKEP